MKRFASLVMLLIINNLYSNGIIRFSENNSINMFGEYIVVTAHFEGPFLCHRGYIYYYNPNSHTWNVRKFNAPILCISPQDSNLWLGTYGKGIIKFNNTTTTNFNVGNTGEGKAGQKNGLISNYVNDIVVDNSNLYCATEFGFSIYNYIENQWLSFDKTNSPLEANHISDIFISENKIWMCSSNYYYEYYEHTNWASEKGNIASFDTKSKEWKVFSGTRKSFDANNSPIILKGKIPLDNSNFENVLIDKEGRLWFSFFGGIGYYYNNKWTLFSESTTGIDFGRITDIGENNNGIWVATSFDGLYNYNIENKKWTHYLSEGDKIPGSVITSIYTYANTIWIKSYDPNFWMKQGLSQDSTHSTKLKENSIHHKILVDSSYVNIQSKDKDDWKVLYNPGSMEFLTVFENNQWQSWELTRMLIDELASD